MSTGVVLLALHLLQALAWAVAFLVLPGTPQTRSFEEAAYFSIVTFTTLGYGDITLDANWRLLSGIEAMNGILLAGWSTALLFSVVQRSWKLSHTEKRQH
jgi:voltage-gated potassium channel Kch